MTFTKPPSNYYLRKGAKSIDYRIEMFTEAYNLFPRMSSSAQKNALIESWLTHLRALLDFFHPRPSARGEDVLTTDYLTTWDYLSPSLNPSEQRRRTHIDKRLAHTTYQQNLRRTGWSDSDHEIIKLRLEIFFNNLPAHRLRWFPFGNRNYRTI